jgi:histidinol-phosphatase
MNSAETNLGDLMQFAVDIARGAGEITLRYYQRSPETHTKDDGSLVTIADLEAEAYLRREIAKEFPGDAILGEEEGETKGSSGRRWIIDPIDGTFAFVHGVPFYGVLIGVEQDGEPTVGVVNMPALQEIVYGANDLGCFYNGCKANVSRTARIEDALLLCTDFQGCSRYGFGAAANELQTRARTSRTWGDCYGYVLLATGRADIMLDPVMNLWDCAALLPVVEAAGGTFTDWRGIRTVEGGNSIATNGRLYPEVMRVVGAEHNYSGSQSVP